MIAEGLSQTEGAELLINYRNDPVDSQELTLKIGSRYPENRVARNETQTPFQPRGERD